MNRRNLIAWLVLILLVVGSAVAYQKRYDIHDWWTLRNYQPSPLVEELAVKSSLSDYGKRLFYVHDPAVLDKAQFNDSCEIHERSLVLGCFDGVGIYILDVTDDDLEKVEQVTAAHEMLHAAYDRLTNSEQENINGLLAQEYERITSERLLNIINQYRERDPDILNNELHSIIGTEVPDISEELEDHYAQYFVDRQLVVSTALEYEDIFTQIENKISSLESQLNGIADEIMVREESLTSQRSEIESKRSQLDGLIANNDIAAYNAAVPGFNNLVNSYNNGVVAVQELIEQYNDILVIYQDTAIRQNEYVNNLDSKFEPI